LRTFNDGVPAHVDSSTSGNAFPIFLTVAHVDDPPVARVET
jgi:hypothetical protein